MRSPWIVAVVLGALARPGVATTYAIPDDFGVAALDLATGGVVWRTAGELCMPRLRVHRGLVVATDDPTWCKHRAALVLDAATGAPVKRVAPAGGIAPLAELPRTLTHRGRTVGFDREGTTGLVLAADPRHRATELVRFDWYATDLHVVGKLAVFTFDSEPGGEVFAYDLDARALAWQFRAYDHVQVPEHVHTAIAIDRDRVVVSVDQHVFALDAATGAPRWHTALPRQAIRPFDAAWTTFGRHGDLIVLRVYEALFALSAIDGALVWQFDAGMLARPWPVIAGDKLYVAWRGRTATIASTSVVPAARPRRSAIVVRHGATGWTLAARSARDAPPGTTRWSTLRPPPVGAGSKVVLTLDGDDPSGTFGRLTYDLSAVAGAETWIEFKGLSRRASLTVDGLAVAAVELRP